MALNIGDCYDNLFCGTRCSRSLSVSLSVSLSLSLSLSVSVCLCLSVSVCLCLYLYLSLSIYLPVSISLPVIPNVSNLSEIIASLASRRLCRFYVLVCVPACLLICLSISHSVTLSHYSYRAPLFLNLCPGSHSPTLCLLTCL